MNTNVSNILALGVLLASQAAAYAGDITLFEKNNFRGRELTLRDGARNFSDIGFNDKASSLVVHSGTWEVCEHKDFGGFCAVFERGEYRNLARFNNSVSSARELERRGGPRGDRDDLDDRDGRDNYGGNHGPNHGPNYGSNYGGHGGRDDRDDRDGRGPSRIEPVELFDGQRFEGRRIAITGDQRSLRGLDFNDRAGSLAINAGQWQFCEHDNFGGQCVVYGPGRYGDLNAMVNKISSLRRVR